MRLHNSHGGLNELYTVSTSKIAGMCLPIQFLTLMVFLQQQHSTP